VTAGPRGEHTLIGECRSGAYIVYLRRRSRNEVPAAGLSPGSVALVEFAYAWNGLDAVDCAQGRRSQCLPGLVVDDLGRNGRVYREAEVETTDLETVIADLLDGQYKNPIRVVTFNTAEKWSQDVSADVAHELRQRCCYLQMRDIRFFLQAFVDRHKGRYNDYQVAPADPLGLIMPYPRPKPPAGDIKVPFPNFIEPELATSVEKVPNGHRWIQKVKFDDYVV